MKSELIQYEEITNTSGGVPDNCNECAFLLETNDTYICRRCLTKGKSCGSMLIYKLLEPKPIRKGPINLKRETMGSLKNFKDEKWLSITILVQCSPLVWRG